MVDVTQATEERGPGVFIAEEANGTISRDTGTIASGEDLLVGTVLGQITANDEFVQIDLGAGDGSEVAAGILYDTTDATAAAKEQVVIARHAEVDGNELVYPAGASQNDIDTINGQLADLEIIVR